MLKNDRSETLARTAGRLLEENKARPETQPHFQVKNWMEETKLFFADASEAVKDGRRKLEQAAFLDEKKKRLIRQAEELEESGKRQQKTLSQWESRLVGEQTRTKELNRQLEEGSRGLPQGDSQQLAYRIRQGKQQQQIWKTRYEQTVKEREASRENLQKIQSDIQSLTDRIREAPLLPLADLSRRRQSLWEEKKQLEERQKAIHTARHTNDVIYRELKEQYALLDAAGRHWQWMNQLSATANGQVQDKDKLALETYVQIRYFDEILCHANVRLLKMTHGQYELRRRTDAADRKSQSGLDLNVADHYNGTVRSVKTLSGGETFLASLALALGLSDEIQMQAGGVVIEAMFVDEGFGTLDEDALDQAVGALEQLTENQCLVGVISHVRELKQRISRQIIVTKHRSAGSTMRIVEE